MGEDVVIVPAGDADLDAIARLEKEAFPSPWRREFFASELDAQGRYNTVARDAAGKLVGYLFSMYLFDEMHVNKIAVIPAFRRRGIALLLMEDCTRFARANRVSTITLEVRQTNQGAQEFYRKLGFHPVYLRKNYYPDGEAAIVMTAEI